MLENKVIQHSEQIRSINSKITRYGGVAANLVFINELPLPDSYISTAKLIYDRQRDTLFKNHEEEWRGVCEHIVTDKLYDNIFYLVNMTECNIRILDLFITPDMPDDIVLTINDSIVLNDISLLNLVLFDFSDKVIKIKIDNVPSESSCTVKYTEVG